MRLVRLLTIGALVPGLIGVVLACSSREARRGSMAASQTQWHGRIYPVVGASGERAESNSVANATMTRLADRQVRATVTLRGGLAGGSYPWHVHVGSCDSQGAILGDPDEYPPLVPGADGKGNVTATFDATIDPGASYHVNVHRSEAEMGTVIACGDLVRG